MHFEKKKKKKSISAYNHTPQCNKLHFVLFHARIGLVSPFCIRGVWPLLYLWNVAMALISFWLHLVFLVSSYSSCSSCPSVPRVPLFHVSVSEVLVSSAIGSPEYRRIQRRL